MIIFVSDLCLVYGFLLVLLIPPSRRQKFDDINWVIRSHKSKTDNTIAKRKRTNNDLQNITQQTKDRRTDCHDITEIVLKVA